ncbi:hypothetical protein SF2A_06675 [Shigella flexneri G1663]|nr:hypothetical protein SF2A_06675 [Shigella flexneri G1663]
MGILQPIAENTAIPEYIVTFIKVIAHLKPEGRGLHA